MALTHSVSVLDDAWTWWEGRRGRYNLVLAAAGWLAYAAAIGETFAFGRPMWTSPEVAVGLTLFLGSGYLILMGFANVAFLLGAMVEAWVRPSDLERYRRAALALGTWGSFAVPFAFPLANLGRLIGGG